MLSALFIALPLVLVWSTSLRYIQHHAERFFASPAGTSRHSFYEDGSTRVVVAFENNAIHADCNRQINDQYAQTADRLNGDVAAILAKESNEAVREYVLS